MTNIQHHFKAYSGRKERYDFLQERFPEQFANAKSILDVGCDDNYLKQQFGDKVFGIDIGGSPDQHVDLEKEALRFIEDKKYNLTICTEVLEHIDNLHEVFDEIVRVTDGFIIISLPNSISWGRIGRVLKTHKNGKFYGLPFEKPVDRHKWYFSYREITDFFVHNCKKKNIHLKEVLYHYPVIYSEEKRFIHRMKQQLQAKWVSLRKDYNTATSVFVVIDTRK